MATHIAGPTVIAAAGNKPKIIEEFIGRVNSATDAVSVARMRSPSGWEEPGQTPEFDEYTLVLKGMLRVTTRSAVHDVEAGQAIITPRSEWVRYSTPGPDGAEYIAICLPAPHRSPRRLRVRQFPPPPPPPTPPWVARPIREPASRLRSMKAPTASSGLYCSTM